jgi:alanine dehydrogenase
MPLRQACATRAFHVVSAEQVAASLPYDRLIPALRQAFAAGAQVPPRHHHPIPVPGEPDATLLLMPAWQTGGYLGVKIIGIFPGNTARGLPGLFGSDLLSDATTGEQLALLDGITLTVRRTAATIAYDDLP